MSKRDSFVGEELRQLLSEGKVSRNDIATQFYSAYGRLARKEGKRRKLNEAEADGELVESILIVIDKIETGVAVGNIKPLFHQILIYRLINKSRKKRPDIHSVENYDKVTPAIQQLSEEDMKEQERRLEFQKTMMEWIHRCLKNKKAIRRAYDHFIDGNDLGSLTQKWKMAYQSVKTAKGRITAQMKGCLKKPQNADLMRRLEILYR